ncbi:ParA family protein [Kitasatospora sp. NPDC048722]|uniref:ParA family protein n=1 Tax=Kitasatospora sp. NPDC048722 TaxID=3155639 RepID=UPI0033E14EF3
MTTATIPIPSLDDVALDFLDVVTEWDVEAPYQSWGPATLVPATFQPATAPRVFVVANNKGGVAKSTTAVELAAAWAAAGFRVRLIDADTQGDSLSDWIEPLYPEDLPYDQRFSLRHVFLGTDEDPVRGIASRRVGIDEATWPTRFANLYLVPSYGDLTRVEYERKGTTEHALKRALAESKEHFDVTVIDASRSMSLVVLAALIAADDVIIPVKIGVSDARAVGSLHATLVQVQEYDNPKLRVAAILTTMWTKSNLARQVEEQLAEDYPDAMISPIREMIRVAEAAATGMPARMHAPRCTATADYQQVARLLLPRLPRQAGA